MKKTLIAAGLAASSLFAVSAASAAPLGNIGGAPAADNLVQKTHDGNVHRACVFSPGFGWHYHSRWRGRTIHCRPPSPGRYWTWRKFEGREGWWHPREKRWY